LRTDAPAKTAQWPCVHPEARGYFPGKRRYARQLRQLERDLVQDLAKPAGSLITTIALSIIGPDPKTAITFVKEAVDDALATLNALGPTPHVQADNSVNKPRMLEIASQIVMSASSVITQDECLAYIESVLQHVTLSFTELNLVIPSVKVILLYELASQRPHISENTCVNYFRALRDLSTTNWQPLIARLLPFEEYLEADPSLTYPHMDMGSKVLYRSSVASLAARLGQQEAYLTSKALELARQAKAHEENKSGYKKHIGYYLIDEGANELTASLQPKSFRNYIMKGIKKIRSIYTYILLEVILSLALSILLLMTAHQQGHGWLMSLIIFILVAIISWESVHEILVHLLSFTVRPKRLPRIDVTSNPSRKPDTAIVIPALLVSEYQVEQLIQSLEAQFLNNKDLSVYWVLLTDLPDSVTPPEEQDNRLNCLCADLVCELNLKYGSTAELPFLVLGRARQFNSQQGVWMGWERKRGKIENFYQFIKGAEDQFIVKVGDVEALRTVAYFVVLDEDSQLTQGAISNLVGTMKHPLNQAVVDPVSGRVSRGYGIIQAGLRNSPKALGAPFSGLLIGKSSSQAQTSALAEHSPNPFQDLFGETVFVGKGIYDAATYGAVLNGRLPQNTVLSHDMIDGAYMRTGQTSDIKILEDFPGTYSLFSRRRHRWTRGDWQNILWLLPSVPDRQGRPKANAISPIYRWAILQNLMRSTLEIAYLSVLVMSWLSPQENHKTWTWILMVMFAGPAYFNWLVSCWFVFYRNRTRKSRYSGLVHRAFGALTNMSRRRSLQIIFFAHQALLSMDAICRTVIRLFTGKRLLEWASMNQAESEEKRPRPVDAYLRVVPILSAATMVAVFLVKPSALIYAIPFTLMWALSPWLSLRISGLR
jgi:hypothetical protein